VELESADVVRALRPDLGAVAAFRTRAVVVTAAGDRPGIDCVSRVFAPNAGIPEDPVTGSAHCALAVYWGARLGRDELVGEQASARGGIVRMTRRAERVVLSGQAVTVSTVHLLV
jgi:predicted PhzF superfamily epimerase YddE/YHI9